MNNQELIEKMAVIMDRLDRIERKIDELKKSQQPQLITNPTPVYPTQPQIWYDDKKINPYEMTCTNADYTIDVKEI